MQRLIIGLYGCTAYAVFLACFAAAFGFIGGLYGKTIDSGPFAAAWPASVIDLGLIAAFALHHSLAARTGFKAWLTRLLPPEAERSTFVLVSSLLLLFLIWQWRPIGGTLWNLEGSPLRGGVHAVYVGGWLLVLVSTFLIDHWELFGVSQVLRRWHDRPEPEPVFRAPMLYRLVRHPMHSGMMTVCWATPTMTIGHLLFALVMTAYILAGTELEERDLKRVFGDVYRHYRESTPRLLPMPGRRRRPSTKKTPAGNCHETPRVTGR